MEKYFQKAVSFFLYLLLFIFPLFFLPFTQEFFITNKLYLLAAGTFLLLLASSLRLLFSKKLSWSSRPFDSSVILFVLAAVLSVLISSPNKIQALLNPNFGLVMMVGLAVLYFYLSRIKIPSIIYHLSSIILSLTTIVFFFQPFKNVNLPNYFQFLINPGFTPVGSQLDLAIFLGFFVVWGITSPAWGGTRKKWIPVFTGMTLTINLLALFLTIYSLLKSNLILPPFRLSWYAALEVLKNPQTAFFGAGIDNFSSVFTRVKDLAYNQSSLWQINTFNVSSSAILQILTETGILGLLTFGLLIFNVFRVIPSKEGIQSKISSISLFVYLLICLFIFPPSLIIWFLFFVMLSVIASERSERGNLNKIASATPRNDKVLNLSELLPIYLGAAIVSFGLIIASGYFLSRSYTSEYYFKKSFDGISENNLKKVYDSQKQAIILNPYIERFRSSFAQTNLLVANNLAQKDSKKINNNDRQTITQAIQTGISEGKAVVSLNPQKAENWKNLASIYSYIINAAQGADAWTISAYQRAIITDPQNPTYRIDLGGVYYSLKKYDDAIRFFEQAASLKPDWPNAQYNLAWSYYQKKEYQKAALTMQNVLNLIDKNNNKTDYEKAQKDLEEFKKKLPKTK